MRVASHPVTLGLLWAGDAVAGSEGLLASPPVRGWALNMSRL